MKHTILAVAAAFGLALTAGPLSAQAPETTDMARTSPPTFESADTDSDGQLSKEEFRNAVNEAGLYANVDTDHDGFIDDNELYVIEYVRAFPQDYEWDLDGDGFLDSGEFYDGVYSGFDDDESGHWDGTEWDDACDEGFWDI